MWVDRESYPGQGLFNVETEGCLAMAILLAESNDGGQTWSAWRKVPIPGEIGPPSLTNTVMKLADGSLALSIETNKHYHDRYYPAGWTGFRGSRLRACRALTHLIPFSQPNAGGDT